jgi:hypothetical protein
MTIEQNKIEIFKDLIAKLEQQQAGTKLPCNGGR